MSVDLAVTLVTYCLRLVNATELGQESWWGKGERMLVPLFTVEPL